MNSQADRNTNRNILPLEMKSRDAVRIYIWRLVAFAINFVASVILYGVAFVVAGIRESAHPFLMLLLLFGGLAFLFFIGYTVTNWAKEDLKDILPWELGFAFLPMAALYGVLVVVPALIISGLLISQAT